MYAISRCGIGNMTNKNSLEYKTNKFFNSDMVRTIKRLATAMKSTSHQNP